MILGLCTITRRSAPLDDVCREAASVGLDGLELWGQAPHLAEFTAAAGRQAREVVEAAGLRPLVMGSYLRPGTASFAADLDGVLAATEGFGAPLLRVWAGERSDESAEESDWQRCLADFRTLLARCGDRVIAVERHGRTLTESAAGTDRLLAELSDPRLQLNYQYRHGTATAEVVAEIGRYGPRIANVHAQSHRAGQPWELATGELDYAAILRALAAEGYDGAVEIEFVRHEGEQRDLTPEQHTAALAADVACLREAVAAAQDGVKGS